jgi:hypothetical protein
MGVTSLLKNKTEQQLNRLKQEMTRNTNKATNSISKQSVRIGGPV